MMVDMSELEVKNFTCIDGCGMCCLCQPELSNEELKIFEMDEYLRNGLTREHVDGRRTAKPNAIKLQGDHGACHFLRKRLCTINEIKPHFCRQFPVHIHVMRRVQLNVNLSCRGVTNGGDSLKTYAKSLISAISENRLANELDEARKIVIEFDQRCKNAGVYQTSERMKSVATKLLPLIEKEDGVAKLLAFADKQPEIGDSEEDRIVALIETTAPAKDIDTLARDSNYDMFNIDDLAKLPVYVDENLRWIVFRSIDGRIKTDVLEEDGTLAPLMTLDIKDLSLLKKDEDARHVFGEYAKLILSRDPLFGNVATVCDLHEYRHDLMTVYLGVLGTTMLDLWWRASLVARLKGKKAIDGKIATEGIRAFDMDFLDAPTIGSFI